MATNYHNKEVVLHNFADKHIKPISRIAYGQYYIKSQQHKPMCDMYFMKYALPELNSHPSEKFITTQTKIIYETLKNNVPQFVDIIIKCGTLFRHTQVIKDQDNCFSYLKNFISFEIGFLKDNHLLFGEIFNFHVKDFSTKKIIQRILKVINKNSFVFNLDFFDEIEFEHYDVLCEPLVTGFIVHEVFGHILEADNDNIAALNDKHLNKGINVIDDGKIRHLGYTPIDDEGQPNKRTYLIKNGQIGNKLHN